MQDEIYFVLNEFGETCSGLWGDGICLDKAAAERCAKEEGEGYSVATYLRAGASILTCVYCGHAYPSGTPTHGVALLTAHIAVCEKHPLRAAEARIAVLEQDRYHVWMRGFQAKVLGRAPRSNPFPEPPITVRPLLLPETKP